MNESDPSKDSESHYQGPPELRSAFETMISNVDEILSSCEAIHGSSYREVLTSFFGLETSLSQLEDMSCDMSRTLGYIGEKDGNESFKSRSEFSHSLTHHYAETISKGTSNIARALEATGKYPDLCKNIEMILERADHDFLDKLNAHVGGSNGD